MTLDAWMGRWYAAKVLSAEPSDGVTAAFRAAMVDDPTLRDQARARVAEFNGIVQDPDTLGQRDFAAAVRRDWLTEALNG